MPNPQYATFWVKVAELHGVKFYARRVQKRNRKRVLAE